MYSTSKEQLLHRVWSHLRKWLWYSGLTACTLVFSGGLLQCAAHLPCLMVSLGFGGTSHALRGPPVWRHCSRLEGWQLCLGRGQTELCNASPAAWQSRRRSAGTKCTSPDTRTQMSFWTFYGYGKSSTVFKPSSNHLQTIFIRWKIAVSSQWILWMGNHRDFMAWIIVYRLGLGLF